MPTRSAPSADFDVAVVGAGPAGMAAAAAAARLGRRVVILDAAPGLGGQYWRHRSTGPVTLHDAKPYEALATSLRRAIADGLLVWRPGHEVWRVEATSDGFLVHSGVDESGCVTQARALVLGTGAHDRQLPFPGWTLPGVVAAGGAQALLKGNGVAIGRRIAVAGTGPLLIPVAAGLAEAGATVVGIFEAGGPLRLARHPRALLGAPGKAAEAVGYGLTMLRHRIRYHARTAVVAALGDREVIGVRVARLDPNGRVVPGSSRDVACDALAVGFGLTPRVELPMQLGCAMVVDEDGSLVVRVGEAQETSIDGVFVAGEACGVAGAEAALVEGEIAGRAAAAATGGNVRGADRGLLGRRSRAHAFGMALQRTFPVPAAWPTWVQPDTTVCRCEEVAASGIRASVSDLGATDARSAKLLSRATMGLCQGRICGYATAALVAAEARREVAQVDLEGVARRPIAFPIPLGVLAEAAERGCAHQGAEV